MSSDSAREVAEAAARDGYGRLVAWLASRCGDLQMAQDAVGDALEAALRTWPERGVPANPEAWLLTTARRRVIDSARRAGTRRAGLDRLRLEAVEAADVPFRRGLPDRRLELLFVCAHPDVPAAIRTPLMLQTVLGLTADRIGAAFLVKPATMGQRLSRAKRLIAEARIPFEVPSAELPGRLGYVLDAIYAAYGAGWESVEGADAATGLAGEAVWLARTVVELLPDAAEALGLFALLLYCESRRAARRVDGHFVPLDDQDPQDWNHEIILTAEKALWKAGGLGVPGPYQLEAAIQSLHAHRGSTGRTDWAGIHQFYRILVAQYPSLGAHVGLAASLGRLDRPAAALDHLDSLPPERIAHHQPYWAVRAHLLAQLDRPEAAAAYRQAAGLTADPAVRQWLLEKLAPPA